MDRVGFVKLCSLAYGLIEQLDILDNQGGFIVYGPRVNSWIIILAAFTILRLMRSELRQYLEYQRGEQAYFTAIQLCRRLSVEKNDLPARAAVIMTQLWTSKRIFQCPDGSTDSLRLRIRSRLVSTKFSSYVV